MSTQFAMTEEARAVLDSLETVVWIAEAIFTTTVEGEPGSEVQEILDMVVDEIEPDDAVIALAFAGFDVKTRSQGVVVVQVGIKGLTELLNAAAREMIEAKLEATVQEDNNNEAE